MCHLPLPSLFRPPRLDPNGVLFLFEPFSFFHDSRVMSLHPCQQIPGPGLGQ